MPLADLKREHTHTFTWEFTKSIRPTERILLQRDYLLNRFSNNALHKVTKREGEREREKESERERGREIERDREREGRKREGENTS